MHQLHSLLEYFQKKLSDHKVLSQLKSLVTDTVTDVTEYALRTLLAFVRTITLHGRTWRVLEKIFAVLSNSLVTFSSSYNWL
jgi:hypothetical protein